MLNQGGISDAYEEADSRNTFYNTYITPSFAA